METAVAGTDAAGLRAALAELEGLSDVIDAAERARMRADLLSAYAARIAANAFPPTSADGQDSSPATAALLMPAGAPAATPVTATPQGEAQLEQRRLAPPRAAAKEAKVLGSIDDERQRRGTRLETRPEVLKRMALKTLEGLADIDEGKITYAVSRANFSLKPPCTDGNVMKEAEKLVAESLSNVRPRCARPRVRGARSPKALGSFFSGGTDTPPLTHSTTSTSARRSTPPSGPRRCSRSGPRR
jgi:hypothetical protein